MPEILPTILITDDESSVRRSLSIILRKNYKILSATNGTDALAMVKHENVDLLLLDLKLPDIDGLEVLRQVRQLDNNVMVVIITAVKEAATAVEAMKMGAYDYITKPFNVTELRALVDKALEKRALIKENTILKAEVMRSGYGEIIGRSSEMDEIFELIDMAAKADSTVLVTGESGTGKEIITRAIHSRSKRSANPFIVINCAAIPDNLLESELFGYERGSFTGAFEKKEGKFELAHGGTLFLDEIGSMSMHLQAKMLRVLQGGKEGLKEFERLGGTKPIAVDVRIIAATNTDLKESIKEQKFREDLYYRLNVLPINIPPLRERKEDIPLLLEHFLKKDCQKYNKNIKSISNDALALLINYKWAGNVRELENLVERLVTLKSGDEIGVEDLPLEIIVNREQFSTGKQAQNINLKQAIDQLERQYIKRALQKTKGNQAKAAEILGIHRNTLFAKIKQLGIKEE